MCVCGCECVCVCVCVCIIIIFFSLLVFRLGLIGSELGALSHVPRRTCTIAYFTPLNAYLSKYNFNLNPTNLLVCALLHLPPREWNRGRNNSLSLSLSLSLSSLSLSLSLSHIYIYNIYIYIYIYIHTHIDRRQGAR